MREPRRSDVVVSSGRLRFFLPLLIAAGLLAGAGVPRARAASQSESQESQGPSAIQVRTNQQLFATLCALYAAGYPDIPADTPPPLRKMVLRLSTSDDPSVQALRTFYKQHRQSSNQATLAQYVSFAMVVSGPPLFGYLVPQEGLPPDVRDLDGFQKLLADFYAADHIDELWQQVKPFYDAEADRLRGPVSNVVTVATAYARRMNKFEGSRTFTVNVDPLIGSMTNIRIYSERYVIAVNPAVPDTMDEIRHAFLHFLLDPLPFDDQGDVDAKRYLKLYSDKAPRLGEEFKYDWISYVDECFVRAVELHLRRLSAGDLAAILGRDDSDGFLMVRPFYYGLDSYVRSPMTLAEYFPQLMKSIDIRTEGAREAQVDFAPSSAEPPTTEESAGDHIENWLDLGNQQIAMQDAKGAVATFERVLKLDPKNVRGLYGLAIASAMTGQGQQAHELFSKIVSPPFDSYADPSILSWAHIYLGRMNDLAGQRERAVVEYRAALAVPGLPEAARAAAELGVKQQYAPPKTKEDPGSSSHR
ncbi:MAG: tetratricopeptide repeat protein [Acidobacteriota bacterium]|nr:tetratricopeptide repeat protein [Acidobacteriota bacterium]